MTKPIIPILQKGITNLSNPQDIILYILRHYVCMPSGASDLFQDMEISLISTYASHGSLKSTFEGKVKDDLTSTLQIIFGAGSSIEVVAKMSDIDSENKYILSIEISIIIDSKVYSTANSITITADNQIQLMLNGNFEYRG